MVGNRLNKTIGIKEAFRLSLQTVKAWELSRLSKSYFFFRSYSPSHYMYVIKKNALHKPRTIARALTQATFNLSGNGSNGTWDTGGSCADQREPLNTNSHFGEEYSWINEVITKTTEGIESHGRNVRFLNITHMTELRPDGHPSRHREPGTPPDAPEDCSHWCLPGVPDVWNQVLYAQLLSMGYDTIRKDR